MFLKKINDYLTGIYYAVSGLGKLFSKLKLQYIEKVCKELRLGDV